jgi:hydrophobe/amphiphile efflux-3 (HAE3) family protein
MKLARFIGKIVERRPLLILLVALLLTGLAAWGVSNISLVTSQEAFISRDSEAYRGYLASEEAFGGDSVMVLVPGAPLTLTSTDALQAYAQLDKELRADNKILSVLSPLTLLRPAATSYGVDLTTPGFALMAVFDNGAVRPQFAHFFPDTGHALLAIRLAGGLTTDEQTEAVKSILKTVQGNSFTAHAIVAGMPRIIADIRTSILSDLAWTGGIAVVLMVLILFLVFPVRWRLLSLPVVLLGVLWAFGIAAAANVSLTLVTLAGLPILIGLGVDFGVQFHNRYEEEIRRGDSRSRAVVDTVSHISPAVGVAVIVMALGFVTLLISAIPAVREFGVLLAIGAAVLYLGALFCLNAVLYRFDKRPLYPAAADSGVPGGGDGAAGPRARLRAFLSHDWLHLGTILPKVARWCRRKAIWVVSAAVVLAALGFVADHYLTVQTDIEKLIPSDTPAVVAVNEARSVVGRSTELPFLVKAQDVTTPSVLQWMAGFESKAVLEHPELAVSGSLAATLALQPGDAVPSSAEIDDVLAALPPEIRAGLITADKTGASISFMVTHMPIAQANDIIDDLVAKADLPPGVTLTPGGTVTLAARTIEAISKNRGLLTILGIAVVLVGLLVLYRSWRRALIAVVPIALVTGWSSGLMWAARVDLNPLTAVLGSLVIAIGTEFTVLLLSRYWEERSRGVSHDQALEEAMGKIGRAITASALTVAAGFGALIASSFPVLRDLGIVVVADVIFALVATVTVVPALVHWLDREKTA